MSSCGGPGSLAILLTAHSPSNAATKLGVYVRGQQLISFVMGTGATIGMLVLGVPLALPLGALAFFAEAVPIARPLDRGHPDRPGAR